MTALARGGDAGRVGARAPVALGVLVLTLVPVLAACTSSRGEGSGYSLERALAHVEVVAAEPHPTGSEANDNVRRYLLAMLDDVGWEPRVQSVSVAKDWGTVATWGTGMVFSASVDNVVARKRGRASTGAVLLVAHYDSAPTTPGAGDDAIGVATVLEAARVLSERAVRNDVIILLSDGHELGLLGAEGFRVHHPWADDVRMVVNFEARSGGGQPLLVQLRGDAPLLAREYVRAAPQPWGSSVVTGLAANEPAPTDFSALVGESVAGVDISLPENWPRYHTMRDTAADVDPSSVSGMGEAGVRLATRFADLDLSDVADERGGVFFPVPLLGVVVYPQVLDALALLVASIMGAAIARRAVRAGAVRPFDALREVGRLGAALVVTVLAGALVLGAYPAMRGAPMSLPLGGTHRSLLAAAGVGAVAAGAGVAMLLTGRSRRVQDRLAGSLVAWWLVGVGTAVVVTGGGYLFAWPLLAALVGHEGCRALVRRGHGDVRRCRGVLLGVVVGVALLVPIIELFDVVLGPPIAVVDACGLVLLAAPVAALLRPAPSVRPARLPRARTAALVPVAFGVCGVALLVVHAANTGPSVSHPHADQLSYWWDWDRSEAAWISAGAAGGAGLIGDLGEAATTRRLDDYLPVEPDREVHVADAPAVALPAPDVAVVGDRSDGGQRVVDLSIRSSRGAATIRVFVRNDVGVRRAVIDGTVLRYDEPVTGWWLKASTVDDDGVTVSLTVEPGRDLSLLVVDTTPGLPVAVAERPDSLVAYSEPIMPEDRSTFVAREVSVGIG